MMSKSRKGIAPEKGKDSVSGELNEIYQWL
jgi:hypothetical protein